MAHHGQSRRVLAYALRNCSDSPSDGSFADGNDRGLEDRFGGNGALSLRRVSGVKQVLRFQSRLNDSIPSDRWLSMRMGLLPDANMAPASKEAEFSVENIWHEKPMGYRVDNILPDSVWGDMNKRKQIYQYCPEVKIIHEMKLERQRCKTE